MKAAADIAVLRGFQVLLRLQHLDRVRLDGRHKSKVSDEVALPLSKVEGPHPVRQGTFFSVLG